VVNVLDARPPSLLFKSERYGCFEELGSSRETVVAVALEGGEIGWFAFWRKARYDASSAMVVWSLEVE
jgi:hypothetical protein